MGGGWEWPYPRTGCLVELEASMCFLSLSLNGPLGGHFSELEVVLLLQSHPWALPPFEKSRAVFPTRGRQRAQAGTGGCETVSCSPKGRMSFLTRR